MNTSISNIERQNQIWHFVLRNQRISIADVCGNFAVSEATARRDLQTLAEEGKIQRVHGGAIAMILSPSEPPIPQRQNEQREEKARIGKAAAALVQDGETVIMGSGTTVLEAARSLRERRNLTVITNSLPVINTLAGAEGVTVIGLGGMLRESELSFIGHITEQDLAEVRADKVLMGTRAISLEHGLMHEYLPETMTDRAILKAGKEIIVVADHTKFGRSDTVLLAPLERVHTIVTDAETPQNFLAAMQQRGIKVVLA